MGLNDRTMRRSSAALFWGGEKGSSAISADAKKFFGEFQDLSLKVLLDFLPCRVEKEGRHGVLLRVFKIDETFENVRKIVFLAGILGDSALHNRTE